MEDAVPQTAPPISPTGDWSPGALPAAVAAPIEIAPAAGDEPGIEAPSVDRSRPDETLGVHPALDRIEAAVTAGFADLAREFRDKLALDRFKEDQITRLHDELQTYRADLVHAAARQILQGLIRVHDDLGRVAAALRQKPAGELTPELFFKQFAEFQDDLELLLGQHGVGRFTMEGEVFEPRRQTAVRTVATGDREMAGRVAERLRPGFEQGEVMLQKERVAVYVSSKTSNDRAEEGQS